MTKYTKLELAQALAARNEELNAARLRISQLEGDIGVLQSKLLNKATPAVRRTAFYEFDPSIAGDFKRASELARATGGLVRRMQVAA